MSRSKCKTRVVVGSFLMLLILMSSAACSTDPALHVEGTSGEAPTSGGVASNLPVRTDKAHPSSPYDAAQMRTLLMKADPHDVPSLDSHLTVQENLAKCPEKCLSFGNPLNVGGTRYQLVTVLTPGDGVGLAGFVVADDHGQPAIKLQVFGAGVWLDPGDNGSVVATDRNYLASDPVCCPSVLRVRIFQNHNGGFEQSEEFTKTTKGGNI
ncbi:hypothetical protein ACX80E_13445 [Arthrobacter sp. TMN-49]